MKIAKLVLGIALLLTGSVAAQTGGRAGVSHGRSQPPSQSLASLWNREGLEARVLFLRLDGLSSPGSTHALDLEFERDGQPLATEKFVLAPEAKGDVEILARHPALLGKIYGLAADPDSRLTLTVQLDGRTLRELSFQDLSAESLRLRGHGLKPVLLDSQVVDRLEPGPGRRPSGKKPLPAKGYQPDPACVQSCEDQYADCSNEGLCNSCLTCEEQQSQCISWCPQTCVDPANVYDWTGRETVGLDLVDYGCYEDRWEFDFEDGHYYATYYYTFKYTTYRRTQYCDGSYSDEVTNVSYYSDYCSHPEWDCSWPASWAPAGVCPM